MLWFIIAVIYIFLIFNIFQAHPAKRRGAGHYATITYTNLLFLLWTLKTNQNRLKTNGFRNAICIY